MMRGPVTSGTSSRTSRSCAESSSARTSLRICSSSCGLFSSNVTWYKQAAWVDGEGNQEHTNSRSMACAVGKAAAKCARQERHVRAGSDTRL